MNANNEKYIIGKTKITKLKMKEIDIYFLLILIHFIFGL